MTAAAAVPQRFYDGLRLREGAQVLDVGCGRGDDVRILAELVGSNGCVHGVDVSAAMVRAAEERGLPQNAHVQQAEVTALPFEDGTFDAVRAERVFQHLTQPDAAAREIFRVLNRDGVAMLIDQDADTIVVAGSEKGLTRRVVAAFSDGLANGNAGRRHRALLTDCGFRDVEVTGNVVSLPFPSAIVLVLEAGVMNAVASKTITAHDGAQFLADLQMAEERGDFFFAFSLFISTGVK
ncbi:MAG: methyltransferase domain-containing protein [Candidatus Eremiobacteraeota bacterium]|nr:methyltransferase domain-containing protein [Candidatus Eremiobacteraeota bacterium]